MILLTEPTLTGIWVLRDIRDKEIHFSAAR